jgi:hypothetical protein
MNWLEFFAALVQALAWPIAVVVAVLLLRDPLGGLIRTVRRAKYGDLDIEFGERVEKLQDQTNVVRLQGRADGTGRLSGGGSITGRGKNLSETLSTKVAELAAISPTAAVFEVWQAVEEAARARIPDSDQRSPRALLDALRNKGVISDNGYYQLQELRQLRNAAVHSPDRLVSARAAILYGRVAQGLIDELSAHEDPAEG